MKKATAIPLFLIVAAILSFMIFSCGKETTRPTNNDQAASITAISVEYPLFQVAEDGVQVAEAIEDGDHIIIVGDPAAPLLLTAFIADEYGDESLSILIHDADIARYIPSIITKAWNVEVDGFRHMPPGERRIGASYDAAMSAPILYRLDGLFASKGLQVIIYEDAGTGKLYIGEKEITDLTRIWFRYPGE